MENINHSPVYNLKAVLKETGLKADVLRAWERRYNLPKPERTPGGHRLYSEYDIETIKWLRARQEEGLSISRAVELWRETIDSGIDPLSQGSARHPAPHVEHSLVADARIDSLRQSWLDAVLSFDGIKADEILNQAFSIYPVETVCVDILQKGVSMMGQNWYLGKATVQQEHFATALAIRRLETLLMATPAPARSKTILIGCPPGEQHTFSLLLLSLFLSRRGLKVVYLGADVPIERLEETSHAVHADMILLTAQQLITAASLSDAAKALQRKGVILAYGGMIFNRIPELRQRIPAHFLGETLEGAVEMVESLVSGPVPPVPEVEEDKAFQDLTWLYQEKRPHIELEVLDRMRTMGLPADTIREANAFFANGLSAALELGSPSFSEPDLEWVRRLLTNREFPQGMLHRYLSVYRQALAKEMGEAGEVITRWLDVYLENLEMAG